ncbi:MAG: cache domain-containing protein [Methylococcaceae bacterium]
MVKIIKTHNNVIISRYFVNSIILISFLAIIYATYTRWEIKQNSISAVKADINKQADNAAAEINRQLSHVMQTGQSFADGLTNGTIAYKNAEKTAEVLLRQSMNNDKQQINFFGVQVTFGKGDYNKANPEELANWYYFYNKKDRQIKSKQSDYDYTLKNNPNKDTSWYTNAIDTKQPFWQEPHFGMTTQEFIVGYSIPFFNSPQKEKAIGVIAVNLSIKELNAIMNAQDYRKIGYAVVLSKEGNVIYHPDTIATMLDADKKHSHDNSSVLKFINEIKKNKNHDVFESYIIPDINEKAWLLSKKIEATDWSIDVIVFEGELKTEQQTISIDLCLIVSALILIIALLVRYLLHSDNYKRPKLLWTASSLTGIAFCIGINVLWHLADITDYDLGSSTIPIKSQKEINTFETSMNELQESIHKPIPYYIPTGTFIKSTKFDGSNNIDISGYVWQKYALDNQEAIDTVPEDFCDTVSKSIPKGKGVVLFEAEEEKIDLSCKDASYSAINEGVVTLGWYFKVQLREPFDYSNYPLDKNSIWLRLRSNSLDEKVLLIPDLNAYSFIFEKALAGIDVANLVLPSWKVLGTFFTEQVINMNTNLGIDNYTGQQSQDLLFNVIIERDFLDAFISTIIPMCIIYLILFVILFSSLEDILAVLGINAGLLFSVALWHSGLRASLASSGITYFETFYFVCYFVISLICINSVLLASKYTLALLHYENNLIPKLVFLPMVFGLTFTVTLLVLF